MEGKFSRRMSDEHIPERKPSYRKAVGANATEKQAKNVSFQNDSKTSGDPVVVFDSDGGLNDSGTEKDRDPPMKTFFTQADAERDKGEKPRREKWTDFAESTSLHGFRFIFARASFWVRLLWIILLLCFTGYVIYSMYSSIKKYFTYPIATVMKIYHPQEGLQFPAVTLCPMTMLTKTKISMSDNNSRFSKLGLNIAACNATAAVRAGRPCGEALLCCCSMHDVNEISVALSNCTEDYKKELLEVIKKNKGSFNDKTFHKAYGPNIRRMIIPNTCVFGSDRGCSHEDFDPMVTAELGLCYSFNAARHGEQVLNASYGDISSGLSLILDLNLHDHMVGSYSEGVRIIVHHQGVYINPLNSLLVAPGTHAQISVRRKVYRNKKWPYETECSETKSVAGYQRYTSEGCFTECLSNATANKCGCRLPTDSDNFVERICFREDRSCIEKVENDIFEGTVKCDCPLACDVVNYESTVSTAAFPNPLMIKLLQSKGYNRTEEYLRKNLVLLQVGYTSLSYEYFKQTSQYDSGALMGEIGGNLGLFLGCSILTVCEFIDFAIYLCRTRSKKKS
ncbi:hypothetical protein ACROYT_G038199 [Oculina patagonica]